MMRYKSAFTLLTNTYYYLLTTNSVEYGRDLELWVRSRADNKSVGRGSMGQQIWIGYMGRGSISVTH